MMKRFNRPYTKTELIGIGILVFSIGLCIDAILGHFNMFTLVFMAACFFFGQRQRNKGWTLFGNFLIAIGLFILFGMVIASVAFRLLLIALLIYFGFRLYRSHAHPRELHVETMPTAAQEKEVIQVDSFFKNSLFGDTKNNIYELDDINIQYGFGDVHIDLSTAFIPDGETVIIIRGGIGSIRLYIPHDMELSMHTSLILGKINLLGHDEDGSNKTCKYQTKDYTTATRKIKIFSTLLVGDIEVRYV